MGDYKDTPRSRSTNRDEPLLSLGMIWVGERAGKGILKNGGCFMERDLVLLEIRGRLLGIPFEYHNAPIISSLSNTALSREGLLPSGGDLAGSNALFYGRLLGRTHRENVVGI